MKLRIALAQLPGVRLDQWAATLESIGEIIRGAAKRAAQLIVLPECVWPAYCIGSKSDYFAARSAGMPGHQMFVEQLATWARQSRIMICAGYVENVGRRLFNTACLISRSGELLGAYRKCFLWDFDHDWFEPGDRIEPFDTEFGRIGMMMCADNRLPEIPATLVAAGAQLILQPTAWVNVAAPGEELWNPQPAYLNAARAIEFGVPVAACGKWGVEGGTTFVGMSRIYDGSGACLAQLGSRETGLAVADVEAASARMPQISETQRRALLDGENYVPPSSDVGSATISIKASGDGSIDSLTVESGGQSVTLRSPTATPIRCGIAKVGAVATEEAAGFAAIRLLALQGAHFVAVLGCGVPPPLAQARAAENRIFIAANQTQLFAPSGLPSPPRSASADEAHFNIDLREAARKQVARDTDTLAGRNPDRYRF